MMSITFEPIGILHTCFKEKFGIPRQPRLVRGAHGILKLNDSPFLRNAVRELETFSHIWLIFVFHRHDSKNWKPSIRPPRLGGAKKVGVLASRSPHRPNPIGLSAVKLEAIDLNALGGIELHLSGVDILDETPILDIKPYLTYADSISDARSGWAEEPIIRTQVEFSSLAIESISDTKMQKYPHLKDLIVGMLELDPRPAFQKHRMPPSSPQAQGTFYGFRIFDFDVKWKIENGIFHVIDVVDFIQT
jgi:tRNA-Thr(GGU) m(6)t(6)A37 methyltransferase TsaA